MTEGVCQRQLTERAIAAGHANSREARLRTRRTLSPARAGALPKGEPLDMVNLSFIGTCQFLCRLSFESLAHSPSVIRLRRMPAYASASLRNLCPFRATPHWGAGSSRREPFGCFNPQPTKQSTANTPPAPSGCSTARKGTVAANLQRVSSAESGNSEKPSATRAAQHRSRKADNS